MGSMKIKKNNNKEFESPFKVGDLVEIQCNFLSAKKYKNTTAITTADAQSDSFTQFYEIELELGDILLCIWINPPGENGNDTSWYQIGFIGNNGQTLWRFFYSILNTQHQLKKYILLEK